MFELLCLACPVDMPVLPAYHILGKYSLNYDHLRGYIL